MMPTAELFYCLYCIRFDPFTHMGRGNFPRPNFTSTAIGLYLNNCDFTRRHSAIYCRQRPTYGQPLKTILLMHIHTSPTRARKRASTREGDRTSIASLRREAISDWSTVRSSVLQRNKLKSLNFFLNL